MLAALALGGLAAAVACAVRNPHYDVAGVRDAARPPDDDAAPGSVEDAAPASVQDAAAASVQDAAPASVQDAAPASVQDAAPASVQDAAPASVQDAGPASLDDDALPSANDGPLDSEPEDVANEPDTNIASGLVGYWKFDEASGALARDSSPNANHGSLVGAVTALTPWLEGRVGRSLTFNPAGRQIVAIGNAAALNPPLLTVAAWANPRDWTGNRRMVQKGLTDSEYRLCAESGSMAFHVFGTGIVIAPLPAIGTWHHYAGTLDGTTLKLYIDGVLVGSATGTAIGVNHPTTDPLFIGGKLTNDPINSNYFFGGLDEVVIYDRALNPAEVALLAAGAQPL
jgi:hypothetical protein